MQSGRNLPSAAAATTPGKPPPEAAWVLWVLLVILVLCGLAVAIPNFVRSRTTTSQNACVNNLRQIDGAKQQWALENKKGGGDVPTLADIAPYLGRGSNVEIYFACPSGHPPNTFFSSYEIGAVTNPPRCKLFPQRHFLE